VRTKLSQLSPAVVVLDMQGVFIGGGFDETVEAVNGFLPRARAAGMPVIVSCYTLRDDLADAGLLRDEPFVDDMRRSAPSAARDPRLALEPSDLVSHHNRPSGFFRSDLEHVLRSHDANAVILTGVSINNAVSATARDAFARDLPALVVRECVAPAPWETDLEVYLAVVDTWGAEVVTADELFAEIR
jgi:nicotinamidase-related amidase